jgi:hypothetical protein
MIYVQCYAAKQSTHYPGDASHVWRKIESSAEHDDMDTLLDEKMKGQQQQKQSAATATAAKKGSNSSNGKKGGSPCIVS